MNDAMRVRVEFWDFDRLKSSPERLAGGRLGAGRVGAEETSSLTLHAVVESRTGELMSGFASFCVAFAGGSAGGSLFSGTDVMGMGTLGAARIGFVGGL